MLGILYITFYMFTMGRIIKSLVEEKELRIKEHMKIMGLKVRGLGGGGWGGTSSPLLLLAHLFVVTETV
jgi:hypothetical protein